MRCVMGDDWLQRVNSCAVLAFKPRLVRFSGDAVFVVWDTERQAIEFAEWLAYAREAVREGYRTMRG